MKLDEEQIAAMFPMLKYLDKPEHDDDMDVDPAEAAHAMMGAVRARPGTMFD